MATTDGNPGAKPSLTFQIILIFLLIIFLGNLIGMGLVNVVITRKFRNISYYNGYRRAEMLSVFLRDYYIRNNFSWDGLETYMEKQPFPGNDMMMRGPGHMQGRKWPSPAPDLLNFILCDGEGHILYNFTDLDIAFVDKLKYSGIPIMGEKTVAGYVYSRSMISPRLRGAELYFLRSLNIAIVLVSLCTTFLFIGIGIFVIRRYLSPVRWTTSAAVRIAGGDYSVRVPVRGKGEGSFLAEQFNAMAEAIGRSEEWKKQIINDTAHELKTPVSVLSAKIEMIKEGLYPADEERLNDLSGQIGRLSQLIKEMEDLSVLESNMVILNREEFPVKVLFDGLHREFRDIAEGRGLIWKTEIAGDLRIIADYGKMEQVFRNLITNAIDFSPEGGEIRVRGYTEKNTVCLEIRDSGPGIPEGERERIFNRFYRVEKSRDRRFGGKGLGLTIARAIVEAHGGRIFVDGSLVKGACFTVRLPSHEVHRDRGNS